MADTPEFKIETLVIAILAANSDLSGVTIGHYNSNAEPAERIGVQVMPKTPMVPARDTTLPAPIWQAEMTIYAERLSSAGVSAFETWRNAIGVALMPIPPATYPAPVLVDALSQFPNGLCIDTPGGGDLQAPQSDYRTLTRTFRVWWRE